VPPMSTARRCLDVAVATVALVVCLPVLAVLALAILAIDGRPVLFRQVRLGEGRVPFTLLKLRTMSTDGTGPGVTAVGDTRITRTGALLRRTSLDELPQLWHVLRGTMTLVGPRPESADLARRYPAECRFVLDTRPGLTGPTQLRFRERSATPPTGWDVDTWYLNALVPRRTACDLEYLSDPTLGRTLKYVLLTALQLVALWSPAPSAAPVSAPEPVPEDGLEGW
jgi:lipopolysaccharide/colanic/teichoic acid biosynthesis glycosyltransferase